jgi:hypothetical protein
MSKLSIFYAITWAENIFTITWANIYSTISFSSYNYLIALHSTYSNLFDFGGTTLDWCKETILSASSRANLVDKIAVLIVISGVV